MFFGPNCLYCGCRPCSVDATNCPHCGHDDPNPGFWTRVTRVISGLILATSIIFFGGFFAVIGWRVSPQVGMVMGGCVIVCAIFSMVKAIWYSLDPTFSLIPGNRLRRA